MARRSRLESITELVEELKLLGVSANGYSKASEVKQVRDERIKKLKEDHGTLHEVCFTRCFLFLYLVKKQYIIVETPYAGHRFRQTIMYL